MAMPLEECCKTVRSSVIVKEVKTNVRCRDELRHQPGPMDHPTQEEIGVPATESEEDRATATQCLSPDAIRAGVETTSHVVDRPRQCEEGTIRQPSLKPSTRPREEGSNRCTGEGEVKETTRT